MDVTIVSEIIAKVIGFLQPTLKTVLDFIPAEWKDIALIGLAVLSGWGLSKVDFNFRLLIYSILSLIILFLIKSMGGI